MKGNIKHTGCNPPEAWESMCKLEPETSICIPHIDSVIEAKCWVDENEK